MILSFNIQINMKMLVIVIMPSLMLVIVIMHSLMLIIVIMPSLMLIIVIMPSLMCFKTLSILGLWCLMPLSTLF